MTERETYDGKKYLDKLWKAYQKGINDELLPEKELFCALVQDLINQIESKIKALQDEVERLKDTRPNDAKWISVEDELPPQGKRVIIAGGIGYYLNDDWHTIMDTNHPVIQWPVTHWMPLLFPPIPAPPKQSREGEEG